MSQETTFQWVKFREGASFESTDYSSGVWYLAEVPVDWPQVYLFGVEYMVDKVDVAEWGPMVPAHNTEERT